MKITISGLAGSGTSTLSKMLSKKLKLKYVNAGQIQRDIAKDRNITLSELTKIEDNDPKFDHLVDEKMIKYAQNTENILLEGRLTGWFSYKKNIKAYKIWLKCPLKERVKRISKRDKNSLDETQAKVLSRSKSDSGRYKKYYNIDINDLSIYDLVVDSNKHKPNAIIGIILNKLKEKKWI